MTVAPKTGTSLEYYKDKYGNDIIKLYNFIETTQNLNNLLFVKYFGRSFSLTIRRVLLKVEL